MLEIFIYIVMNEHGNICQVTCVVLMEKMVWSTSQISFVRYKCSCTHFNSMK